MYLDFLYIPLNYFSVLNKKEIRFEVHIPLAIGIASLCYSTCANQNSQYIFIQGVMQFIETLLGFTLAALTLLLSNDHMEERTKNFVTKRKKRNKPISMYELLILQFSHLIVVEALLCIAYYIANLFQIFPSQIVVMIANTLFIFVVFHTMLATIRAVSCIYLIATGLR